ncbi:class I SAM-dependent methyltransferase [Ornithinimicrobium cryptoxanthini]|uniref:Methyltransferase domain-containing protein n=1 Tax=Ornithinimicrobium cryptoxanthini TaxID=2934161 RepID=A0ABY4YFJ8_9MICO|nr:class I SAM-dependent methyltransferase [Ornithinimicrobium cryptoxanthini]USQ75503.1 methyltransferase domain-containing protein [Ornithinimicrobium cryptoxanthini]
MPDSEFDDPRLAPLYDILDPDRSDLDTYLAVAEEIGARSVLDVGCGTGTFGLLLARLGMEVTGVDPAGASLAVARGKEYADRVTWVHGDATALPPLQVDLATMTANVAQVFLTDDAWGQTLGAIREALRPGGHLAFESRVPAARAWEGWTPERTLATTAVPGLGPLTEWMEVTAVQEDPLLVSFTAHNEFPDGQDVISTSTLRFRSRSELESSLRAAGFGEVQVGDLPYAPGRGWLVRARRPLSTD